ncbi:transposable element Tcb1 transposase [Trichonephila clavipes]|nr:transposable element Tcb1 transposase [Trichonephila clavipes]
MDMSSVEISEELGMTQTAISRLWQRFQDDGNESRSYSTGHLRDTTLNEDRYLSLAAKRNRRSIASDLSRHLCLATGTTVLRQNMCRCLGQIALFVVDLSNVFHLLSPSVSLK